MISRFHVQGSLAGTVVLQLREEELAALLRSNGYGVLSIVRSVLVRLLSVLLVIGVLAVGIFLLGTHH